MYTYIYIRTLYPHPNSMFPPRRRDKEGGSSLIKPSRNHIKGNSPLKGGSTPPPPLGKTLQYLIIQPVIYMYNVHVHIFHVRSMCIIVTCVHVCMYMYICERSKGVSLITNADLQPWRGEGRAHRSTWVFGGGPFIIWLSWQTPSWQTAWS